MRECALRGFALGRKFWLFLGSDRAAVTATLIVTDRPNDIDTPAWLADVLAWIASFPQGRLHELLPWNWSAQCPVYRVASGSLTRNCSPSARNDAARRAYCRFAGLSRTHRS
jgi:hypothetical protein